jgi:hypothetical protein
MPMGVDQARHDHPAAAIDDPCIIHVLASWRQRPDHIVCHQDVLAVLQPVGAPVKKPGVGKQDRLCRHIGLHTPANPEQRRCGRPCQAGEERPARQTLADSRDQW